MYNHLRRCRNFLDKIQYLVLIKTLSALGREENFLKLIKVIYKNLLPGFPGGAVVGSPPASAGDTGSGPGPGGSHMPRSG